MVFAGAERGTSAAFWWKRSRLGARDGLFVYRFVLKPWLWLLSQRSDCKIFHNKTALDIIKEIFDREGKKDFDDRTVRVVPDDGVLRAVPRDGS